MTELTLKINGEDVSADVESRLSLADFIRDHRRLTGTHLGCEHGVCGACTVLMNGEPVRSCITFAVVADGTERIRSDAKRAVVAEVRARFADELATAGWIKRFWVRWKIHRAIEKELDRLAPPGGLYFQRSGE